MSYLLTYEEAAEIVLSNERWERCRHCYRGYIDYDIVCGVCSGTGKTLSRVYQEAVEIVEACNDEGRSS